MASNKLTQKRGSGRRRPSSPLVRKVVLMTGQLGVGGTEKQISLLAQGLSERNIETSVWYLLDGAGNYHERALKDADVRVMSIGLRGDRKIYHALANFARFGGMVADLRRECPDILHAFLFPSYVVAAPAARMAGVPVVVAGRRSLGNFKKGHPGAAALEYLATRATDLLIANAAAVAEDARRNERVKDEKIEIVYNGLPGSAFTQVPPAAVETTRPVVLYIANLLPYKGHRYLLEAISRLERKGRRCTLLLAGEGGERQALERQAASLGIDARFLGQRVDVGPLLARADVVAHASLEEGMSNAVMEAMAAARAIVATDAGGTPELLRERGLLVPPADSAALADGIERLLTDRGLAARLGQAARDWAFAHLSASAMVDRHVQIYSQLLERRCAV